MARRFLGKNSDSAYGVVQRYYAIGSDVYASKDDVATAGTNTTSWINVPYKAKLWKFGIQALASDVVLATDDGFELRNMNGTQLATFVAAADYTLGTGAASGQEPETATSLKANVAYVACVASDVGVSGSVIYFVDVQEDLDI